MGLQSFSHGVEYVAKEAHNCTNDPLTRPEKMMGSFQQIALRKLFSSNCQKPGNSVGNCFSLRKCFNCNEKGHVAKNFKKTHSAPASINSFKDLTTEHLEQAQPILIKVLVSDIHVFFLCDTGSHYITIT